MPLTSQNCTIHDLREAAEYGATLPCRVCGEAVSYRDAVLHPDLDAVLCSENCLDALDAEYQAYIECELARARREFKSRTPQQARRVTEWNVFADAVNARA